MKLQSDFQNTNKFPGDARFLIGLQPGWLAPQTAVTHVNLHSLLLLEMVAPVHGMGTTII